jgi:hypothetical protein
MRTKILIAGGVILFLWWMKHKKDAQKQEKKLEAALQANEMPTAEQVDIIRLKIEDWLQLNMPFMSEDERLHWVMDMTTGLEEYKQKYIRP